MVLLAVPRVSADWIGATSGSGYVDGGDKDYLHTGNWSGGTINDRFTATLAGALAVYLDGDRTGAPYKSGGNSLYIETADSTPRTLYLNGNMANAGGILYLGASTSTKLIVDLNGADRQFTCGNQQSGYIYAKVTGSGRLTLGPTRGQGINLYNPSNDWTGGLTIGGAYATVYCHAANVIPSGPGKGSLYINNVEADENLQLNGFPQTVNDLSSATTDAGNRRIRTASGTPTLTVLSYNNSTYTGIIQDGIRLTKDGPATLTLAYNCSYSGATTVEAGALLVNGNNSGANGAVTVKNNATLGGTGTVGGSTTVQSGGILAPGTNGVGTLTIDDNLVLSGGAVYNWQYNMGVGDLVQVNGTLTLPVAAAVTVNVGQIGGDMPSPAVLLTASSKPVGNISGWTVTGAPGYKAKIDGNSVILALPSGTRILLW